MKRLSELCRSTLLIVAFCFCTAEANAQAKSFSQSEWDKTLELAKKEGKIVVSIPATNELRSALEKTVKQRFGIEVEIFTARGSASVRRIVDETKAGVRYFDVHIGGSESIVGALLPENVLEPLGDYFILPEVRDPKSWWGGHIWTDNARKYVYTTLAYSTENFWYNSQLMKPEEIRSFDDFLNEKWKGKLAFLDPRTPGSGASLWSYLRELKGEEYLKKLVAQNLLLGRDQRLLAENVAKGKAVLAMGLTYYSFAPFVKAGLPVAPLPTPKEGVYISGGSGHVAIVKNPPHPNATKIFFNWLLGREGQDLFTRAIGQGTRRLDVDTKWLPDVGVIAAKDVHPPEEYVKRENNSETKINRSREPGAALARKLLAAQ